MRLDRIFALAVLATAGCANVSTVVTKDPKDSVTGIYYNLAKTDLVVEISSNPIEENDFLIDIRAETSGDPRASLILNTVRGSWVVESNLRVALVPDQPGLLDSIHFGRTPRIADTLGVVGKAVANTFAPGIQVKSGIFGNGSSGTQERWSVWSMVKDGQINKTGWLVLSNNLAFGAKNSKKARVSVSMPRSLFDNIKKTQNPARCETNRPVDTGLSIQEKKENEDEDSSVAAFDNSGPQIQSSSQNSVYYRELTPIGVKVEILDTNGCTVLKSREETKLFANPIGWRRYDFPKIKLAKKEFDLKFRDGALISVDGQVDSEIYSAVRGLLFPAQTAVDTVSGIFKVDVTHKDAASGGSKGGGNSNNERPKD